MRRRASSATFLAALATGLPPAAGPLPQGRASAQAAAPVVTESPGDQDPAGTAREALERARDAQRRFERDRRRSFPRAAFTHARCDEHIGRFCLTHDGDDEWIPTPEPPGVREGRGRLLAILDSVAARVPGDDWLLGQRVAYRVEAGRAGEARALARACRATPWWCVALEGLVLHARGRTREAEAVFDAALARLPAPIACRWRDISDLLDRDDRDRYDDLPCPGVERETFEREVWLLADPLWSEAGLERRVEHLARRVRIELQTDAASGYDVRWGRDLEELTVRYGWPEGWDVAWRRDPGIRTERAIQAHRSPAAQRFIPIGLAEASPGWRLDDERPRSTWAPPSGPIDDTLDPQIAVFRRAGRRLVIAALEPPAPAAPSTAAAARSGPAGSPCRASLHLAARGAILSGTDAAERALRALEPVGAEARWAGVERRCPGRPGAARARRPLPVGSPWLSDVLLFEPGQTLPGTLDAALVAVRGSNRVQPGEALGVFWEWYGPPEPASVTIELTREDRSFLRKALEWTGLAARRGERAGVRWTDPGAEEGHGRAVRVELPDLAPGRYRLTLQVQSARVGRVLTTRELVVAR